MLAGLLCNKWLATGFADSALNHQVIARLEVFNGVAQFIQAGEVQAQKKTQYPCAKSGNMH
ncbi:hypothetical protein GCM10011362_04960 [Marinobacter halophilus]|nr:hypothetical protein GCM10011362_04960 [Marinobacter halophilus]